MLLFLVVLSVWCLTELQVVDCFYCSKFRNPGKWIFNRCSLQDMRFFFSLSMLLPCSFCYLFVWCHLKRHADLTISLSTLTVAVHLIHFYCSKKEENHFKKKCHVFLNTFFFIVILNIFMCVVRKTRKILVQIIHFTTIEKDELFASFFF